MSMYEDDLLDEEVIVRIHLPGEYPWEEKVLKRFVRTIERRRKRSALMQRMLNQVKILRNLVIMFYLKILICIFGYIQNTLATIRRNRGL